MRDKIQYQSFKEKRCPQHKSRKEGLLVFAGQVFVIKILKLLRIILLTGGSQCCGMKLLWDAKHYILEGGKKSSPPQSQLIDEWTNKNVVYSYNEIFFALKKEGNSDTFSNTDQHRGHSA